MCWGIERKFSFWIFQFPGKQSIKYIFKKLFFFLFCQLVPFLCFTKQIQSSKKKSGFYNLQFSWQKCFLKISPLFLLHAIWVKWIQNTWQYIFHQKKIITNDFFLFQDRMSGNSTSKLGKFDFRTKATWLFH